MQSRSKVSLTNHDSSIRLKKNIECKNYLGIPLGPSSMVFPSMKDLGLQYLTGKTEKCQQGIMRGYLGYVSNYLAD